MLNSIKISKFFLLIGLLIVPCIQKAQTSNHKHNFETAQNLEIFNTLYKTLDLFYVDTLNAKKTLGDAIQYMLSNLDPYTVYYSADDADELAQLTTGKYAGIGALIRFHKTKERVAIAEPFEGTPAARAGLRAGDIIVAIDNKPIAPKMKEESIATYTSNVSSKLRGEPNTVVEVAYLRGDSKKPVKVKIARERIRKPSIICSLALKNDVGYIALADYTENVGKEVKQVLDSLKNKGIKQLILDLRGNGGGLLSEAQNIVNLFIPKGKEVVRTEGRIPSLNRVYVTQEVPTDTLMPLVVLVNGVTASAAEITSGALQDYDRAVIMGKQTYGKGLVQQPRSLPYGASLKLTTSKYYIPSGRCIQKYDFRHRNTDGSAKTAVDSTTGKFYTKKGREMKNIGGIEPDVITAKDSLPNLLAYLMESDVFFDYVNDYRNTHAKIAEPQKFSLTDEEYEAFSKKLLDSNFSYDKQSKQMLERLSQIIKFEGYEQDVKPELEALEKKLAHNLEQDLKRWKKPIIELINGEIIRRYYFEKGLYEYNILVDKEVQEAQKLLSDTTRYYKILEKK